MSFSRSSDCPIRAPRARPGSLSPLLFVPILTFCRIPHFFRGRVIVPDQKIHVSVALIEGYKPKATFHTGMGLSWDKFFGKGRAIGTLEELNGTGILELDTFHVLGINNWLERFIRDSDKESLEFLKLSVSTSTFLLTQIKPCLTHHSLKVKVLKPF